MTNNIKSTQIVGFFSQTDDPIWNDSGIFFLLMNTCIEVVGKHSFNSRNSKLKKNRRHMHRIKGFKNSEMKFIPHYHLTHVNLIKHRSIDISNSTYTHN